MATLMSADEGGGGGAQESKLVKALLLRLQFAMYVNSKTCNVACSTCAIVAVKFKRFLAACVATT